MIASPESTLTETPRSDSSLPAMPPSTRDLAVYEFVAARSKTTREAADEFGISQTRVRQVLAKVVEFLVEALPGDDGEHTEEQKLIAAERLANMRLDYLYGESLNEWRRSREATSGPVPLGKVCYLNQAVRVAVAAAKLPLRALPLKAIQASDQEPPTPPLRDCSKNEPAPQRVTEVRIAPSVVTVSEAGPYEPRDDAVLAARREFVRPAQTPNQQPLALPDNASCQPDEPPALSRQQRRRREREEIRRTKP
jgi:hypothetical protein